MTAKVLKEGIMFLGKARHFGDLISNEELSRITDQTKSALVSQGILEVEGMGGNATMSAADKERFDALQASFDSFREATTKNMTGLHTKLDAALLLLGKKARATTKGKA